MRTHFKLCAFLLIASLCILMWRSQGNKGIVRAQGVVPSGCQSSQRITANLLWVDTIAGKTYECVNNLWVLVGPSSGGGAVSSVFTRTGDVTAQTGDYTCTQVTNCVPTTRTVAGHALSSNVTIACGDLSNSAAGCTSAAPTLVEKTGSGSGSDYTSASSSYVPVDNTNLTYTVTIPAGSKLSMSVSGTLWDDTANDIASAAIGSGTCSTVIAAIFKKSALGSGYSGFSLNKIVAGDGASHTYLLCFSAAGGGNVIIANGDSANTPFMDFRLETAN